jgi:hypothetical protein
MAVYAVEKPYAPANIVLELPHAKRRTATVLLCLIHDTVVLISTSLIKQLGICAATCAKFTWRLCMTRHRASASPALLLLAVAAQLTGHVPASKSGAL